ncbi:DDE_3 domain-containing protein [Trichonephila clavipes]|nr:DDE_3 domain-containing protein [Trichonephila clavipes]
MTAELNQHQDSPVRMIAVRRHLHKQNIYGRAAIPKPFVTDANAKRRVHVWRTPAKAYDRYCLPPTDGSVTIWAAVSWFSAGSIVTLKGRITEEKYREILADHVHPMMQTFFPAGVIFQYDNASIHIAGLVQS